MSIYRLIMLIVLLLSASHSYAIMERDGYPWNVELRSFLDRKGPNNDGDKVPWLLNLGPTGIRAQIYPDKPNLLVVKYVFEDAKCPAKGLIQIDDVIAGANGKLFTTSHRFGRGRGVPGGWDGPMMELAGHIENSQGSKDGILTLIVWPKGEKSGKKDVKIQLKTVGRFSPTFPYNCPRSEKLLEDLCDFLVADYESGNWKSPNSFYGGAHCQAHQLLALMASGIKKYDPLIKKTIDGYHNNKYDQGDGGFKMWIWGFDGIVMGEAYRLYNDKSLAQPMKNLAEVMAWGSFNRNGIYTHRSYINIKVGGGKPYASMAAISGLDMIAMSIFKSEGLFYDKELYETIHQHYLGSTSPDAVNIAYAFGSSNSDDENPSDKDERHAVIKLKDPSKGKSGKGPGYVCPTGMKGIGAYELIWPTKADPRWKPTDWIEKEASENILEENTEALRIVYRNSGTKQFGEPTSPYSTKNSGGHLAPVGMGALAHLIGNKDNKSWGYLGMHAANTCVLGPGYAFDGHAAANLHAFWSVLGAARSNRPDELRKYFDYMKTFLVLSECHNGGLYLQPWGRDRPGMNSDPSFGPRILPTATGAILLSLPKKRLLITGADTGAPAKASTTTTVESPVSGSETTTTTTPEVKPTPTVRKARKLSPENRTKLDEALKSTLAKLSEGSSLKPTPLLLSVSRSKLLLTKAASDGAMTFQAVGGSQTVAFTWNSLTAEDRAALAQLVAVMKPDSKDPQAMAGVYLEAAGQLKEADDYFSKAGEASTKKFEALLK